MPTSPSLPECPSCFGKLYPLSVCRSCDTVAVREGLLNIGANLLCEDCGAENPTHFACGGCNSRFSYSDVIRPAGPTCPVCGSAVADGAKSCANCGARFIVESVKPVRLKRGLRGEFAEEDVAEIARILNVGKRRAEALCIWGYGSIRKLQKAGEGDLAKVPGIGVRIAAQIKGALEFQPFEGRREEREQASSEEYECPLCGVVTSALSTRCYDCGAAFEGEDPDEGAQNAEGEEEKGLLAFYDVRLHESPGDSALHYARAVLLLAMGRAAEALAALDRALELRPADPNAIQAKARALALAKGFGMAAQVLREAVQSLVSGGAVATKALEIEAAEDVHPLPEFDLCPECGSHRPWEAEACPICGHRPTDRGVSTGETPSLSQPEAPSLEAWDLLGELQRAVAGEEKAPPPPLEPEVAKTVITGKRVMLTFLSKIPGVSKRAAEAVSGFFQDLEQVGLADVIDIADIPGVAPAEARLIKVAVESLSAPEPETPKVPKVTLPPAQEEEVRLRDATPSRPPPPAREAPAPPPTPVSRPQIVEVTSPSPVGQEARRGLVNGSGLVNGRGRVNGLVNGVGYINGVAISEFPLPQGNFVPRYVAVAAALLLLFSIAAILVEPPRSPGIAIDGNFEDWTAARVPEYLGGTRSANANVEIAGTSLLIAESTIFLRLRIAGTTIFADPVEWDTMYAFLDTDGTNTTGYDLDDLGAEYAVRVSGSAGRVEDGRLMRYVASGRARDDWAGFVVASELPAAASATQVEVSVPGTALEGFSEATLRVLFAFDDNEGETSHTLVPIGAEGGALLIEMAPLTTLLSGGVQPFLDLTFRSLGNVSFVVQQVTLTTQGNAGFSGVPGGIAIGAGSSETRTIAVDTSGVPQGTLVTAAVTGLQIEPARPYAVMGPSARGYVGQHPAGKIIDGLFGDWPSPIADSDASPPRRSALNILNRDGNVSGTDVFLYAQFEGTALEGGLAPGKAARPSPPEPGNGTQSAPGSGGPPPPLLGLDYVRFYVDTDARVPGGHDIGGLSADRLLEIRGRNGRVRDASAYRLVGSSWVREADVDAGVGADRIELGVTLAAVSFNGTRFAVVSADWAGVGDTSDALGTRGGGEPGTRAPPSPPIVLDVSGNGVFFLRDTSHASEVACTHNKVASWTKGTGPAKTIILSASETACWYIDSTTNKTIPTGTWETLLDLTSSGSPTYDVAIQIWNLDPNTVEETVVQCSGQTAFGDDVRCFADTVPQKSLSAGQVVRVLLAYASGSGTVTIEYDDSDTTGDSRATLPIPDLHGLGPSLAILVVVVFVLTSSRRLRRAALDPRRPKILLA